MGNGKDVVVQLPGKWQARDYQLPLWRYLRKGGKRATSIWHRRSGKDEVALHWTAIAAWQRPATYWYLLPLQTQARRAIWDAVNPHTGLRRIDEAFPLPIRDATRENEMTIRFKNGSMWHVVGSDNFNSLVGSPPAGVVFSEWALSDPAAWGYLRPILAENDGWALFITTPRGDNHAKTMLNTAKEDKSWFSDVLSARDTGVFTAGQLDLERREYMAQFGADQGRALFEQEYLCSFEAAVLGAFYAEELRLAREDGRIGKVPIDRTVPVHTAWDLGVTDATAIWFIQVAGREVRLVDYHEESGTGLDHYVDVLDEKKKEHGWRYADGNNRAEHWFPHDVEVRELTTGVSRTATLRQMGINPVVVPAANVFDGINAVRRLLQRAWIDEKRCARGLSALQAYRRDWSEQDKTFRSKPLHDWSSHGCIVGSSLVKLERGYRRIDEIGIGDFVWTPAGPGRVTAAGRVGIANSLIEVGTVHGAILCTPDHKIATARGFIRADALRSFDRILTGNEWQCRMISWFSKAANIGFRAVITAPKIGERDRAIFIARSGSMLTVLSQRASKSITRTVTALIAASITSNSFQFQSTSGCMPSSGLPEANYGHQPLKLSRVPPNGIDPKKGFNGTGSTVSAHGKIENGRFAFVRNVARSLARLSLRAPNTATSIVSLRQIDAATVSVYDLTIEKHGCYQANGLLVSNSDALRTFAMGFGDDSGPERYDYNRGRDRRWPTHRPASWMSA